MVDWVLLYSLVPLKSRGAALLALTGDVEFVRHIRNKAVSLGMHLNEFGLWRWQAKGTPDDGVAPEDGFWELVRAESEEEILRELEMEYVEAAKRNFLFVVGRKTELQKSKT
jgi:DNA polymerase beta